MSMNKCMNSCVKDAAIENPSNSGQKVLMNISGNIPVCVNEVNNSSEVVRETELNNNKVEQQRDEKQDNLPIVTGALKSSCGKKTYNEKMIKKYKKYVKNGSLEINNDTDIFGLSFTDSFKVTKLDVKNCKNVNFKKVPQLVSHLTIKYFNQNVDVEGIQNMGLTYLDLVSWEDINKIPFKLMGKKCLSYLSLKCGLTNLAGIEKLSSLEELILSNNQIKQIDQLQNLGWLQKLYLDSNKYINNIQYLKDHKRIKYLNLSDNKISDISHLKDLTQLTVLELNMNQIEKIEGLENLKNLEILSLNDNKISVITALQQLKTLKTLNLEKNRISNLSALLYLEEIQTLSLSCNKISNLYGLEGLKNVETLNLDFNQINSLEGLYNTTSCNGILKILNLKLSNNLIENIEILRKFDKIQNIFLDFNHISDLSQLYAESLYRLSQLDLQHNLISNITALSTIHTAVLNISYNYINDLSPIQDHYQINYILEPQNTSYQQFIETYKDQVQSESLSINNDLKVTTLKFSDLIGVKYFTITSCYVSFQESPVLVKKLIVTKSQLKDLSGIQDMNQLIELDLSQNQIENIDQIQYLDKLTLLNMAENQIENLEPLHNLKGLRQLSLQNNQICDVEDLEQLTELAFLDVCNNYIIDFRSIQNHPNFNNYKINDQKESKYQGLVNKYKSGTKNGVTNGSLFIIDDNDVKNFRFTDYIDVDNKLTIEKCQNIIFQQVPIKVSNLTIYQCLLQNIQQPDSYISGIQFMNQLTYLKLFENILLNISPISQLTNLTFLSLESNQISNIEPLKSLIQLSTLILDNNKITDISCFNQLINLKHLSMNKNLITSVKEELNKLIILKTLYINENQLENFLTCALHLEDLNLSNNQNGKWQFNTKLLVKYTYLMKLTLSYNRIDQINGLDSLKYLEQLYLQYNQISDITQLKTLNELQFLNLEHNKISDFSPLKDHKHKINYQLGNQE
ncbi:Conserved_hypothetical protein [Hexamita inflata]|uniref:Uncharacterized protein n=1 Tax=Hexamita inflata TaxID=28002 RepID=A0AA86NMG9_9EUKA|nr:Conserved hypothetical protein [Hexamita inflata]